MASRTVTSEKKLTAFFSRHGSRQIISGNNPLLLNKPDTLWLIESGSAEIFSVNMEEHALSGTRHHFCTIHEGQIFHGQDSDTYGEGLALLAIGVQGTIVYELPVSALAKKISDKAFAAEFAESIENWVLGLSGGITRDINPRTDQLVEAGDACSLKDGQKIRSRKELVWLHEISGRLLFIGMEEVHEASTGNLPVPVTHDTWLQAMEDVELRVHSTEDIIQDESFWKGLDAFYRVLYSCEFFNTRLIAVDQFNQFKQRTESDEKARSNTFQDLMSILKSEKIAHYSNEYDDPLLEACKVVCDRAGIELKPPAKQEEGSERKVDFLKEIARSSNVMTRRVLLKGDWWKWDNGPLLGYFQETNQPVALLPTSPGKYELIDPVKQERVPVDAEFAEQIAPVGYVFYRPFPYKAMNGLDVLKFGLRGMHKDVLLMFAMGVLGGILAMIVPIATGYIIDTVIPGADKLQLWQVAVALVVSAIATALFFLVRSLALLRIEATMDTATQAAVWDRLLNLPMPFFRSYTAGDLAVRANGISAMRRMISGATISSLFGGIFAVFNFGLLFYYDWQLAIIASGLTLFAVTFSLLIGYFQLRYQREIMDIQGTLSGKVLQFITGIAKLRVTGSEDRAFNVWAGQFTEQRRLTFRARNYQNAQEVFSSVFPIISNIVIFSTFLYLMQDKMMNGLVPLTTGQFLTFFSAYAVFTASSLALSGAALSLLNIIPLYERTRPILEALPEVDDERANPGELVGELEVNRLSFRYSAEGPLILNNLNLRIEAGEFVAIVGPSGSGKSTLLRLLLGFEQPVSGSLYYDGHDLSRVDVQAVRRQIGVVLQSGKLFPGDIFSNIVGSSLMTLEDAWEAARMAGLDQDIRQMPMGMHTVVSEGGSTFSGGQRQRLMIARAVVNKPRILFFDEATSALDNRTQAIVSKSLEELQATRIVIAHRLSTIINADKIIVLEAGKVVQQGTYEELIQQEGTFAELAKRQMA